METKQTHPLIIAAAVSIILASAIAIASMTGLLPNSQARMSDQQMAQQEEQMRLDEEKIIKEEPEVKKTTENQTPKKVTAYTAKTANKPLAEQTAPEQTVPVKIATVCNTCGRVVEIRERIIEGEGSGIGAVAGGVVGGLLGNQIGGGNGNKVATAAGVLGGAVLGNKIEKSRNSNTQYDVEIQYDAGGFEVLSFSKKPNWQSGDSVKVIDGQIVANP